MPTILRPSRAGRVPVGARAGLLGLAAAALLAPAAASAAPETRVVLVKTAAHPTSADLREVRADLGAVSVTPLAAGWRAYHLRGRVSLAEARRLLGDTDADQAVALDGTVRLDAAATAPADPAFPSQWALANTAQTVAGQPGVAGADISALDAWGAAPSPLAPVTVAVVDEGVDFTNPDLAGAAWSNPDAPGTHGYDVVAGRATTSVPDAHGTQVASVIAARANDGVGIAGVAPNARIMSLRFIDPVTNTGRLSDALTAMVWAREHGARVVNASWSTATWSAPLCDTIQALGRSGVVVVAAAGNDGVNTDGRPRYPAACAGLNPIAVAASDNRDRRASFTNVGASTVDLAAPGVGIVATSADGATVSASGTSMAAPHVSGAAAVLLGARPASGVPALKDALMRGATPVAAFRGVTYTGGRLNVAAALALLTAPVASSRPSAPPDTTPPTAPTPREPGSFVLATRIPQFSWGAAGDPQSGIMGYDLWIDGDLVRAGYPGNHLSATSPSVLKDGVHTWTLVARNGAGLQTTSVSRTFTVLATAPAPPVLTSPATNSYATPGSAVTFTWATLPGLSYGISIDGRAPVSAPGGAFTPAPLPEGLHSWAVIATGPSGLRTSSEVWTLRVAQPPPAPPTLTGPATGATVTAGAPVTFTWTPVSGVTYLISIDGRAAVSAPAGSYTAVSLAAGTHVWCVTAVGATGARTTSALWTLTAR